jgi:hypothetical protein
MGFVAFRAARRRSPRHEVLPFEALILTRSRLSVDGEPSGCRADVTQQVSPLVHRLPCPLVLVAWTSRRCSTYEAVFRAVLPPRCFHLTNSMLPWACPVYPVLESSRIHQCPLLAQQALGLTGLHRFSHNRSG